MFKLLSFLHLLLLIGQLFSAALALFVVSRRTRVSGKCLRGTCPGGNVRNKGGMSVHGVLVWSTETVDGRPSVLHLRRSRASWLNARSLLLIGHYDENKKLSYRPSDRAMRLVSSNLCHLPRNSAETTYTTSPDQTDGMKLEV